MNTVFRLNPLIPLTRRLPGLPVAPDPVQRALCEEHSALLQQMGALQKRVSEHFAEYARRVTLLEADNLRLRAELVRSHTSVLWGLQGAAVGVPLRRQTIPPAAPPVVEHPWREAQAVICQTACVGHAHVWLDDDGQCRRSGERCQPQGRASEIPGAVSATDIGQA